MNLAEQLRQARWFGGKSRDIRQVRVVDRACWSDGSTLCFVDVDYADGPTDTYVLAEHFDEPVVARGLLNRFAGATVRTEAGGVIQFRPTHLFGDASRRETEPVLPLRGEQSNTSIRFGDALILKLFRRVQFGPNPDVEVGWFLTEHSHFTGTPAVVGSVEYTSPRRATASLALLQRFEPNRGDAWTTTLARVRAVLAGDDMTESVAAMARLGETTADLHLALGSGSDDFSAEPITPDDILQWRTAIGDEIRVAADALSRRGTQVDVQELERRAAGIDRLQGAMKIRHHGDYHLGQVLERDAGAFVIIDFEGEPSRPLAQRREKRSALRDVAGMLRSFDYARHAALREGEHANPERITRAADWYDQVVAAFRETYLRRVRTVQPSLLPSDVRAPLAALEMEKAAYEVMYELNNRPDWLPIPLAALTTR